jgi:N-acetylglucosaminylphosphatidylinositol deacetylase
MPPSSSPTPVAAPPSPPARQTRTPASFSLPLPLPLLLPILFLLLAAFIPAPPPADQLAPLSRGFATPGKALLLTAHPDDEVMFFAPTLMALVAAGWEVSGLCLSTGERGDVALQRPIMCHVSCLIYRRQCGRARRDPPA